MNKPKVMIVLTESNKSGKYNITENYIFDNNIVNLKYNDISFKDFEKQREKRKLKQIKITED